MINTDFVTPKRIKKSIILSGVKLLLVKDNKIKELLNLYLTTSFSVKI